MLRLSIAVLACIVFVESWPVSKEHDLLLARLRRSPHYCGPEYNEGAQQVPPASLELQAPPAPPVPLQPSIPFYPRPAPPVPLPPTMPFYPPPPFWPGHHHHHHRYHGFEYQPKYDQLRDYQNYNPPCDTCKGKGTNTAVSNAKSETGNAVAIAISKPK